MDKWKPKADTEGRLIMIPHRHGLLVATITAWSYAPEMTAQTPKWHHVHGGLINDVTFYDENQGCTAEDGGRIRYTADGGISWTYAVVPQDVTVDLLLRRLRRRGQPLRLRRQGHHHQEHQWRRNLGRRKSLRPNRVRVLSPGSGETAGHLHDQRRQLRRRVRRRL